jgi:hypothetical protein
MDEAIWTSVQKRVKKSYEVERIFKRLGQRQTGEAKEVWRCGTEGATHFTEQGNQRKDGERAYTTGRQPTFLSAVSTEVLAKEYILRSSFKKTSELRVIDEGEPEGKKWVRLRWGLICGL